MGKIDSVHYYNDMLISNEMISEAIHKLQIDKSVGLDGVYAESIKFLPIIDYLFYFRFVSVYILHIVICLKI